MSATQTQSVTIGAKGQFSMPVGSYLYIGSAKRNWQQRINRHLRQNKRVRWHIDYLLAVPTVSVQEVWLSRQDQECHTAKQLAQMAGTMILGRGIGSSDCRCPSHFLYLKEGFFRTQTYLASERFIAIHDSMP